jgi:hypothetical protein
MPEQAEEVEPAESKYDPGPDFKAKVKEVLEELGLLGGNKEPEAPASESKSKVRTLRQEEADSEFLVNKVLDKLKSAEPPVKKEPEKPEPEVSPGPPPKKRKIQSAMWG